MCFTVFCVTQKGRYARAHVLNTGLSVPVLIRQVFESDLRCFDVPFSRHYTGLESPVTGKINSMIGRENSCFGIELQLKMAFNELFHISKNAFQLRLVCRNKYEIVHVSQVHLRPYALFRKVIEWVKIYIGA